MGFSTANGKCRKLIPDCHLQVTKLDISMRLMTLLALITITQSCINVIRDYKSYKN